jgi:hypothetical protein
MNTILIAVIVLMTNIVMITLASLNIAQAGSETTGTITCQSQQGTTMGGIHHFGGNCIEQHGGVSMAAGLFSSDSQACEVHGIQGPNNNIYFKEGCLTK